MIFSSDEGAAFSTHCPTKGTHVCTIGGNFGTTPDEGVAFLHMWRPPVRPAAQLGSKLVEIVDSARVSESPLKHPDPPTGGNLSAQRPKLIPNLKKSGILHVHRDAPSSPPKHPDPPTGDCFETLERRRRSVARRRRAVMSGSAPASNPAPASD